MTNARSIDRRWRKKKCCQITPITAMMGTLGDAMTVESTEHSCVQVDATCALYLTRVLTTFWYIRISNFPHTSRDESNITITHKDFAVVHIWIQLLLISPKMQLSQRFITIVAQKWRKYFYYKTSDHVVVKITPFLLTHNSFWNPSNTVHPISIPTPSFTALVVPILISKIMKMWITFFFFTRPTEFFFSFQNRRHRTKNHFIQNSFTPIPPKSTHFYKQRPLKRNPFPYGKYLWIYQFFKTKRSIKSNKLQQKNPSKLFCQSSSRVHYCHHADFSFSLLSNLLHIIALLLPIRS